MSLEIIIPRDYAWEEAMKTYDPFQEKYFRANIYDDDNLVAISPSGLLSNADRPIKQTLSLAADELYVRLPKSNRLRSVSSAATISDFARYTYQALKIWDSRIVFQPLTSPVPIDATTKVDAGTGSSDPNLRIVTWHVYRRAPGTVSGRSFEGPKEIKPRVREDKVADNNEDSFHDDLESPDPEEAQIIGYKTFGQMFDNYVQFDIWSNTAYVAEETADTMEEFLEAFRGSYRMLGVNQMTYGERIRDEFIIERANTLKVRSIRYYIRTETVRGEPIRPIRHIEINAEYRVLLSKPETYLRAREAEIIQTWAKKFGRPRL